MANVSIDTTWIIDRFNLQYNNILSNQAPGVEPYEISMYLNMAHIEIIDEYSADLDTFEKNRSILTSYIYDDVMKQNGKPAIEYSTRGINYQLFEFTKNYWKILKEYAITQYNEIGIVIKPIKYDEFNTLCQNPNKRPNGVKGWRLDINFDPNSDSKRDVKIFFKKLNEDDYIKEYRTVYLITPDNFDLDSGYIPDTIKENFFLSEKVINRAVELATRDYKPVDLQNQILTNNRSK